MSQPDEIFHDEGDEVIEEIRAVRHRISERFGHDPERLVAHYIEIQEQHRDRLLRPEPRPETSGKTSVG
jgi:hypothetical protein